MKESVAQTHLAILGHFSQLVLMGTPQARCLISRMESESFLFFYMCVTRRHNVGFESNDFLRYFYQYLELLNTEVDLTLEVK